MNTADKLGILIPVFNGGDGLAASIRSCAVSGLGGDQYECIVVDNCSTDGAVRELPECADGGARIRVFSNASNIGRVENWNRALELASELGFRWVTFLFAGDLWIPGDALSRLFRSMREADAAIAFAPFVVADGKSKRTSQRFHVNGSTAVCGSREFVSALLASGLFPLGPLQANIYRIDSACRPFFDPSEPTRTDVDATLRFIVNSGDPVVVGSDPFLEWQDRPGRFHASMGAARTVQDYMATFQLACRSTDVRVDYGVAKARILLNSLRLMVSDAPLGEWPSVLSAIAQASFSTPHRVSARDILETLWSRFALGRRLLQFG